MNIANTLRDIANESALNIAEKTSLRLIAKDVEKQSVRIRKLEGYKEGARDCLQSAKKRIKELEAEIVDLKSQKPPCSANCYHHQTHPCENCGRINGYLPSVWQALKRR